MEVVDHLHVLELRSGDLQLLLLSQSLVQSQILMSVFGNLFTYGVDRVGYLSESFVRHVGKRTGKDPGLVDLVGHPRLVFEELFGSFVDH